MTWIEALILGLVQGLTEFLPVSSSGHLVIGRTLFDVHARGMAFEVAVHGATLAAVLVYFRRRLSLMARRVELGYVGKLVVGTLPVVVVALMFRTTLEAAFASPMVVVFALAVTGSLLLTLQLRDEPATARFEPGWGAALVIGCAQAMALTPGISRSGATIVVALWLGMAPAAAAEFSFLLSIPAIAGAVFLQRSAISSAATDAAAVYGIGVAAAFGAAVVAMFVVLRAVQRGHLQRFGWYCWALAIGFGVYLWITAP